MKAAAISAFGGLDVLHVMDVKEPTPAGGEVVLRVLCAGLNHLDIWVRNGRPGSQLQMPHVLGSDAVGIVTATGEAVQSPKVGEQVIVYPGLSCGRCEFCRRGEQSLCVNFGIMGLVRPGTFAERVAVPAGNCYSKPSHLSDEEAGVLALAHVTAWRMLMSRAQIKPGETLLIHGIGGGVAAGYRLHPQGWADCPMRRDDGGQGRDRPAGLLLESAQRHGLDAGLRRGFPADAPGCGRQQAQAGRRCGPASGKGSRSHGENGNGGPVRQDRTEDIRVGTDLPRTTDRSCSL